MIFDIEVEEEEIIINRYEFKVEAEDEDEAREIAYDTYYEHASNIIDVHCNPEIRWIDEVEEMPCDAYSERYIPIEIIGGDLCAG